MLENLRKRMGREEGFTLIELLVVMLILGILAAIAIPSFLNQRDKAHDADAKAEVRTAQTAMETYATDNDGKYTGATVAALHKIEATLPDASTDPQNPPNLAVTVNSDGGYTVTATSTTNNTFSITRLGDGTVTYSCATKGSGGCPSDGNWPG